MDLLIGLRRFRASPPAIAAALLLSLALGGCAPCLPHWTGRGFKSWPSLFHQ